MSVLITACANFPIITEFIESKFINNIDYLIEYLQPINASNLDTQSQSKGIQFTWLYNIFEPLLALNHVWSADSNFKYNIDYFIDKICLKGVILCSEIRTKHI